MILFILTAAHFLADFTFQPGALAQKKAEQFRFLALHSCIYAAVMAVFGFFSVQFKSILPALLIIALSHFALDWIRLKIDAHWTGEVRFWSFVIDQLLHLAVITGVYFSFHLNENMTGLLRNCFQWEYMEELVIYGLLFIIIWDPASVFVKKLFTYILGQKEQQSGKDVPQAGSLIGKLERLIIVVLVIFNQLGGIGFVLTAKSIARFRQFEEQGFAEKYLVGTLTSTSIAIIASLALKKYL